GIGTGQHDPDAARRLRSAMVRQLLDPGERQGEEVDPGFSAGFSKLHQILRGDTPGGYLRIDRSLQEVGVTRLARQPDPGLQRQVFSLALGGAALAVWVLFFYLAVRRRIDVRNAALIAALALLFSDWGFVAEAGLWELLIPAVGVLWLFALWSTAESLLREVAADSTTGLDAVRLGRLGRRAGRSLLLGFASGAGLAGLALAALALAMLLPGVTPLGSPFEVPFWPPWGNAVFDAARRTAWVMLALALAGRVLRTGAARRAAPLAPVAAAVAVAFLSPVFATSPAWLGWGLSLALAGALVEVERRFGLTALLTASLVFELLPSAATSVLHLSWMPVSAAATVSLCAGILGAGLLGLSRQAEIEESRVKPPAFMRRMAEERRSQYELDLLSRMQLGLLPQELPAIPGYEIATRSLLATEAGGDLYELLRDEDGGLWVAVGDVAGHGYSCAIAQAMTLAVLASLVPSRRSPAQVLGKVHHVLREESPTRLFTTLTLLRLQPETGEVVLANAGHPPPLLADRNGAAEQALSGLPLGQGPARTYGEIRFVLPPGAFLLLYTDGLIEAQDGDGGVYDGGRLREILRLSHELPAAQVIEELLGDWRRHQGSGPPADDTTVVVVRRAG
ncbi:MAG TPA: SpoIIE family protein phosphatase, partial [Thermoanaerobaculia bacterium]|nr:SpoIIE family protein phosphatase [Thermoanaerobaculia bacterium]